MVQERNAGQVNNLRAVSLMKIEWLECLVALKKYNSISKAAEACFTTTQNFGKVIKNLESEMGFALLKKEGRNLVLTEAALDFANTAEKMIMTIEQTKLKYHEKEETIIGKIDIIANDFDTIEFLLDNFVAGYPGVTVSLNEMEITSAFQYIIEHPQTIGILPVPANREQATFQNFFDYLNIITLCKDQTVCLASKYSDFAKYKAIRYEDLAQEKIVNMRKSAFTNNFHEQFLKSKVVLNRDIITTNSYNYFFAGVSKNLFKGISIMSDYNSTPHVYKENVVAIPIEDSEEIVKCLVYHAQHKKFSEAEQILIKTVEEFYRQS